MTQPLILDAAGVALTPLRLGESLKSIGAEFRSEGAETEGVSGLPLEEAKGLRAAIRGGVGRGVRVEGACGSIGDCWKGLGIGSTLKCLRNSEAVGVRRMLKVSEVGVGKTLRCFGSGKQVVP